MSAHTMADQLAQRLKQAHLLVVGDLMLDCYHWGDVRRISPEAPVPVVRVREKSFALGGAGNVAANLAGLGCATTIIGLTGEDEAARKLNEYLADCGVDNRCVVTDKRPTTTKTRIMAGNQQLARLDEEDSSAIDAATRERIVAAVTALLPETGAVILSDYGKGIFDSGDFVQQLIDICRKARVPVFIDPKGSDWQRYRGAFCITPNTAELELVVAKPASEDADLIPAAGVLRTQLGLDWLLVTRGPRGMALFGDVDQPVLIAALAREVFDVSGAGDTVIATLAACVAAKMPMDEAAAVANTAAGIVVGKLGTQPVGWSELAPQLETDGRQTGANSLWKVSDVTDATSRLTRWRQAEQRIVFTNGCFDLLHPGHVSLLHQARQLGDRLIVGLNTDDSIRRLKGEQRPILPGADRAAILSALEDVDMVVFFDEDTPITLIEALRPDILVKGADYRPDQVVGKEVVEAYGGCVRLVEILAGHSTTAIANKLSENNS